MKLNKTLCFDYLLNVFFCNINLSLVAPCAHFLLLSIFRPQKLIHVSVT